MTGEIQNFPRVLQAFFAAFCPNGETDFVTSGREEAQALLPVRLRRQPEVAVPLPGGTNLLASDFIEAVKRGYSTAPSSTLSPPFAPSHLWSQGF